MSFSTEYTEYKINELKELGAHPEQPDAAYQVNSKDVKDYSLINKIIIAVITVPWLLMALGVVLAPAQHHPEPAAEATEEAAPAAAAAVPAEGEAVKAGEEGEKAAEAPKEEAMPAGEGDAQAAPKAE